MKVRDYNLPDDLYFHSEHTWVRVEPDGRARVGLNDFAQSTAGEVTGALGLSVEVQAGKGRLFLTRSDSQILPEPWGACTRGRGRPREETARRMWEAMKAPASELELSHIRDFLECVRSRRTPAADVEEGHLSATLCHIGNISTRLGRSLRWDAETEDFVGDPEASRLLDRPYRAPWRLPEV